MEYSVIALNLLLGLIVASLLTTGHAYPRPERLATGSYERGQSTLASLDDENVAVIGEQSLPIKVREKRLSDQRRAELEALVTLSKMRGNLVPVSKGGRQLDLQKIGRRKRSAMENGLKNLEVLLRLLGYIKPKGNPAAYPLIRDLMKYFFS